jgi:hypothetical protein
MLFRKILCEVVITRTLRPTQLFPAATRSQESSVVVSISRSQRDPLPQANWVGNVYHGLLEDSLSFHEGPGGICGQIELRTERCNVRVGDVGFFEDGDGLTRAVDRGRGAQERVLADRWCTNPAGRPAILRCFPIRT